MAYNISGVYSLPLAARVSGDLITAAWANTSFNDFATAFNSVLVRDGTQPMTGQLQGWFSAFPAFCFNGDITTGVGGLSTGANTIRWRLISKNIQVLEINTDTTRTPKHQLLYDRGDGVGQDLGFAGFPVQSKSADYTLVYYDKDYCILHPSTDANVRTFTIPANSSVAYPIGTEICFVNGNSGVNLNIAITTDTMRLAGAGTTGTRTLAANGIAKALKIGSTEWIISGTNLT